jgi:hypothetical protein
VVASDSVAGECPVSTGSLPVLVPSGSLDPLVGAPVSVTPASVAAVIVGIVAVVGALLLTKPLSSGSPLPTPRDEAEGR